MNKRIEKKHKKTAGYTPAAVGIFKSVDDTANDDRVLQIERDLPG